MCGQVVLSAILGSWCAVAILQLLPVLKTLHFAPGPYLLAFLCSLNTQFILGKDEVEGIKEVEVWPPGLAAQGFC